MSRTILIAFAGGGASAIMSMAFLTGSPSFLILANAAPLPLFLVGLSLGASAGTIAGVAGLVFAALTGGFLAAATFGLVYAVPTLLALRQTLLRYQMPNGQVVWYPPGSALAWLAALAAGAMLVGAMVAMGSGVSPSGAIEDYLHQMFLAVAPTLPDANRVEMVGMVLPVAAGISMAWWVGLIILNGLIAQAMLKRMGRNLRPSPSFASLDLPDWLSWPLVASAALTLAGSGDLEYIGRNLAIVLAAPFFFLGLAVVHLAVRRTPSPTGLLAVFYFVIVLSSLAQLAVAGLGVVEKWVGIRHRLAGPQPPAEIE